MSPSTVKILQNVEVCKVSRSGCVFFFRLLRFSEKFTSTNFDGHTVLKETSLLMSMKRGSLHLFCSWEIYPIQFYTSLDSHRDSNRFDLM